MRTFNTLKRPLNVSGWRWRAAYIAFHSIRNASILMASKRAAFFQWKTNFELSLSVG